MCNTKKQNYSVHAISSPPNLTPLNTKLPIAPVELHKTKKSPPAGKEYLCYQINSRSPYAAQCVKSRMMNKAIDSILSIDKSEKKVLL